MKISEKGGIFYLSGVLNEYADFTPLLAQKEPLRLNLKQLSRLNSIGIRNLLKFLTEWGTKQLIYEECPSEFVDQVNMIPGLLGIKNHGKIESLFVPYECDACDTEEEALEKSADLLRDLPEISNKTKVCSSCGGRMTVLSDSFFIFLARP